MLESMKKVRITQIKSGIGRHRRQKATLTALGFKRLHQTLEVELSPSVQGMIESVKHLLRIEEI
jgi:large subunit ribosomal protein L30